MKKPFRGDRQYIRKVQKELTDKKMFMPKLTQIVILGLFEDNSVHEFDLDKKTQMDIITVIMYNEGQINIFEKPIEGVTITKK